MSFTLFSPLSTLSYISCPSPLIFPPAPSTFVFILYWIVLIPAFTFSSIISGELIVFNFVISSVCFVLWLNLLFISLFVPTSLSVNSCKSSIATSTLYVPFAKSVNSYSPCAFVVVLVTSALLVLFNSFTVVPSKYFSLESITPFLLLSSHTFPCIFLLTTCACTVPVCICSESVYTCAIALFAYTFSGAFPVVFSVISMSNLDFPTISPFIAKPVVFSFNDAPIVFSDQILSTPIPVSFAVILFTLSEFVVNSCKLSVDCVEALII